MSRLRGMGLVLALALSSCATNVPSEPPLESPLESPPAPEVAVPVTRLVRVAAIQAPSTFGAPDWNRDHLEKLVRRAAEQGAKVVVLPECAITGYLSQDLLHNWHVPGKPLEPRFEGHHPEDHAETVPGPSTERFAALARELGIYVTVPFLEVDKTAPDPRYFNTVCLAAPNGKIVAHYRKLTPWPYPEKSWASDGDRGVQTFDTEFGRVGLAICFDIHTILDLYREHDLWALLYPIAWVSDQPPVHWFNKTLPDRVRDVGHHVIGANWSVERPNSWFGYGYSTIIRADGTVVAQAKTRTDDEIVFADLPYEDTRGRRDD